MDTIDVEMDNANGREEMNGEEKTNTSAVTMIGGATYISNLKNKLTSLKFKLTYKNIALANAIRRTLIGHIPVWTFNMDINSTKIKENNTIFEDDKIRDKLKFIPFKSGIQGLDYDKLRFSIDIDYKRITQNSDNSLILNKVLIYSDAIKLKSKTKIPGNIPLFMQNIPIVSLNPRERLIIEDISLKRDGASKHTSHQACIVAMYPIEQTRNKTIVQFRLEPRAEYFNKQYPISLLTSVKFAIGYLIRMCGAVISNINRLNIKTTRIDEIDVATITIEGFDHTLGSILQHTILEMFPDTKCEYKIQHPLEKILIVKMISNNPKKMVAMATNKILDVLKKIMQEVNKYKNIF